MARDRRRGGRRSTAGRGTTRTAGRATGRFSSSDLPGTLENLVRGALEQVGVVRDVALRQAMNSRARFDEVMLQRRRREVCAELGEVVHELVAQGELGQLAHHPELAEIIADLDELSAGMEQVRTRDTGPNPGFTAGPARWRRDRGASSPADEHAVTWADWDDGGFADAVSSTDWTPPSVDSESRVWRPVMDPDEGSGDPAVDPVARVARPDAHSDDSPGASLAAAIGAALGASASDRADQPAANPVAPLDEPAASNQRPVTGPSPTESTGGAVSPPWQSTRRRERSRRRGRGGIVFASDHVEPEDDLADYMHEDDVPDAPAGRGDSNPTSSDATGSPDEAGTTS